MALTVKQRRVVKVLDRLKAMAKENESDAEGIADMLEDGITELHSCDFFGTEGQSDPRGDFREDNWSMSHVQGVDKPTRHSRRRTGEEEE